MLNLIFTLHFFSPPTPEGNIGLFSCQMLHCVHQVVTNSACLLFGAKQVVYFFLCAKNSCLLPRNAKRAMRLVWLSTGGG